MPPPIGPARATTRSTCSGNSASRIQLGLLYSAFTAFLGFRVNNGEYKVMGMSPYGEPRYVDKVKQLIRLNDDGSFGLNMDYFSYHYSASQSFNGKFVDLFGEPRVHSDGLLHGDERSGPGGREQRRSSATSITPTSPRSIQVVTEEALLNMANALHKRTGSKQLVMAGGVALNSVANFRVLHGDAVRRGLHPAGSRR